MVAQSTKSAKGKKAKSSKKKSKNAGARAPQLPDSMPSFETEKEAINTEWQKYKDAGKDAFVAARAMGKQLAEIRAWIKGSLDVKSKEQEPIWNVWCEKNLPFKRHQANRYIRVWNDGEELPFEGEITSVRAAIAVLSGKRSTNNDKDAKQFRKVYGAGRNASELIEAGPMGGYEGGSPKHRIRVTWRDDTLGKELSDMADRDTRIFPRGTPQALQACAKLFGLALTVDDGIVADRLRKLMFDLWEQRHSKEAVVTVLGRLERAMIAPPVNRRAPVQQQPGGTPIQTIYGGEPQQRGPPPSRLCTTRAHRNGPDSRSIAFNSY